jgi:hypothetical protein
MHVGNEEQGFSVDMDAATSTLRVKAWGFWTAETAEALLGSVVSDCPPNRMSSFVLDAVGLKPQREEGQRAIGSVLAMLSTLGIARAHLITDSSLTKLQLMRITKECGARDQLELKWTLVQT